MPPRRTPNDERRTARRPAGRHPAEEDQDSFDDREPEFGPEDDREDRAPAHGHARGASGRVTAAEAAQNGVRSLVDLIGKKPEGVTAVEPTEDGWLVGVEVIEDQRVPSSADILAVYEAELDSDGALVSYRRTARYARGKGDTPGDG
jgi:gas vesicle protein GvpO